MVSIKLEDLTDRQLHLHLIRLIAPITRTLTRLETQMAELSQSLEDLTAAVDAIGTRFQELVTPLQQALADAQAALEAAEILDVAQNQAIADALAAASEAAATIEEQVTELNAIGTPPVEPTP